MQENDNDKAPLFRKWGYWYVLVLAFLSLLIIFFSVLTERFR